MKYRYLFVIVTIAWFIEWWGVSVTAQSTGLESAYIYATLTSNGTGVTVFVETDDQQCEILSLRWLTPTIVEFEANYDSTRSYYVGTAADLITPTTGEIRGTLQLYCVNNGTETLGTLLLLTYTPMTTRNEAQTYDDLVRLSPATNTDDTIPIVALPTNRLPGGLPNNFEPIGQAYSFRTTFGRDSSSIPLRLTIDYLDDSIPPDRVQLLRWTDGDEWVIVENPIYSKDSTGRPQVTAVITNYTTYMLGQEFELIYLPIIH